MPITIIYMTMESYQQWHFDIYCYASIILNSIKCSENQIKYANGITKVSAKLLNDQSETARNLVKHSVAKVPVWLRRDLHGL